jgi:hypothetical protein
MKNFILLTVGIICSMSGISQKRYFTKTGNVSFRAGTSLEDIDGVNKSTTSVFDATTGQIEFALLVKGFEFNSALLMEHFNENYMESDKYPKSLFKGNIANIDKVNFQKDGVYPVTVKGTLEIHGVKKEIETTGEFKVSGGTIAASSEFSVVPEDYKISIPGVVRDKISKTAKIKINCSYSALK